jgi:hypothetical protein
LRRRRGPVIEIIKSITIGLLLMAVVAVLMITFTLLLPYSGLVLIVLFSLGMAYLAGDLVLSIYKFRK